PETERRVRDALEQEPPRAAPRPLLLPRAQRLCAELAELLGGIAAGDPRRWRDACERLAVVVAANDAAPVLARFADLPQVVAVGAVPGLDGEALRRQGEEIAAANAELAPFRILRGVECDILRDGGLDAPDDVLAELDWVQLSLHAGQRAARDELTRRVLDALH